MSSQIRAEISRLSVAHFMMSQVSREDDSESRRPRRRSREREKEKPEIPGKELSGERERKRGTGKFNYPQVRRKCPNQFGFRRGRRRRR